MSCCCLNPSLNVTEGFLQVQHALLWDAQHSGNSKDIFYRLLKNNELLRPRLWQLARFYPELKGECVAISFVRIDEMEKDLSGCRRLPKTEKYHTFSGDCGLDSTLFISVHNIHNNLQTTRRSFQEDISTFAQQNMINCAAILLKQATYLILRFGGTEKFIFIKIVFILKVNSGSDLAKYISHYLIYSF